MRLSGQITSPSVSNCPGHKHLHLRSCHARTPRHPNEDGNADLKGLVCGPLGSPYACIQISTAPTHQKSRSPELALYLQTPMRQAKHSELVSCASIRAHVPSEALGLGLGDFAPFAYRQYAENNESCSDKPLRACSL